MTETLEEILAWATVALAVGTILSPALIKLADALVEAAAETETSHDDKIARGFRKGVAAFARALDVIGRVIPVVTSGGKARK